ncbi:DnaJ domain-containing protein [Deltaproteobacteria bacterium OttesenSCG-928-M10]|nr:DnaJ domain-containing protein [Deltaproteobacteria bacterium OttesenSCG-928-M10]
MAQSDYYTLLGVGRKAAGEELKRAYRRLAVHWHPDRNPGSRLAEEKFKAISEAYAVLSNPVKRRQYDLLGPSEFKNEYSHEDIFQGFEPGDFFKFFGLADARETLSRIFSPDSPGPPAEREDPRARISDFFGGFGQKSSARDTRSPDIIVPLMVTFKEAALGAEKFVAYNTPGGAVKVRVLVPAGALNGQRLAVKGQGPARPGGSPGDVLVNLTVIPDPDYTRRGFDIQMTIALDQKELTAGCRPTVNTLAGQALRLTVPAGTKPGAIFKLPNYGLPKPDGHKGDFLVQVKKAD